MAKFRTIISRVSRTVWAIAHISYYDVNVLSRRWTRWLRFMLMGGRALPLFAELALETTAHCNRHCPACPVSIAPRGKGVLDEALFAKILGELTQIQFAGRIALHFFNEPLLDKQIVGKVRRLAAAAPRASIEINSNGDFLTPRLAQELFAAGLGFLFVTAYNDRALRRLERIRQALGRRQRMRTVLRRAPDFMGNRAGALTRFAIPEPLRADCFHPCYKLVINYKGEAVICTNDYFAHSVMGHVAERSLLEIWRGAAFEEVRGLLRRRERGKLPACKGCNLINTPLRYRELTQTETLAYNRAL